MARLVNCGASGRAFVDSIRVVQTGIDGTPAAVSSGFAEGDDLRGAQRAVRLARQIAASLSLLREPRSRPAGDEIGIQERTPSIENLTVKRRYLSEREVERLMAGFCSRPV